MKILKLIGHPITVLCLFLLLLISGESFGGFYMVYILLGLTGFAPHAVLATAAVAFLVAGYNVPKGQYYVAKPILYILSIGLMLYALVTFFKDSKGYNDSTFDQGVPIASFILFGFCAMCNLCQSTYIIWKMRGKEKDRYKLSA